MVTGFAIEQVEATGLVAPHEAAMQRACEIVSRVHTLNSRSLDEWTGKVAKEVQSLSGAGASTMTMVCEWGPETGWWRTVSLGLAGRLSAGAGASLRAQAARGWPDDDFSRTLGHASLNPPTVCARRQDLLPDELWWECGYAAFRRGIGLHDLARAVVPIAIGGEQQVFVMQFDGLTPEWRAPRSAVTALQSVMQPIARAYERSFVEPILARQRVLDTLSPTQREIAPLLAEGLTEVEIAGRVHRSIHTVHDHTRAIYRALRVSSKRELRDLWLGRG